MTKKALRQQAIQHLIAEEAIHSQEQLLLKLAERGISITQTTLSRDLTELNVLKGASGYVATDNDWVQSDLEKFFRQNQIEVAQAMNLVVLKTLPGRAQLLGLEIDNAQLQDAVGNIAGDDTVFIATTSEQAATKLLTLLSKWAKK